MENEPNAPTIDPAEGESKGSQPKPRKRGEPGRVSAWASVTSAAAALVAVAVTLLFANLSLQASKDSELRSSRVQAYSAYIADLATFNQLMWANIYWTGTDVTDAAQKTAASAAYWEQVVPLQSRLEADYSVATMFALGSDTEAILNKIHFEQQVMVTRFACMAEAQSTECKDVTAGDEVIPPASNKEISAAVRAWSDSYSAATATLIKVAADKQVR